MFQQARLVEQLDTWNERTQRLFTCDCAEHVFYLYEREYPNDSRVRNAIEIARKVANGDLPLSELAAARDAAWAAARAAARDAAWAAARAAAWAAETEWQAEKLLEYLEIG